MITPGVKHKDRVIMGAVSRGKKNNRALLLFLMDCIACGHLRLSTSVPDLGDVLWNFVLDTQNCVALYSASGMRIKKAMVIG